MGEQIVKVIDGVEVVNPLLLSEGEIKNYIDYLRENEAPNLTKLRVTIADEKSEYVKLEWESLERKFERIRRITGYLVGTVDRWNDGKQAELKDRVIHGIGKEKRA